ncbi:hypothetical protein VTK56DRAFT_10041 [Thermocarpiscus australiensis]
MLVPANLHLAAETFAWWPALSAAVVWHRDGPVMVDAGMLGFIATKRRQRRRGAEARGKLVYLGRLLQSKIANTSIWREIRGYKNYIIIGSEAVDHGTVFRCLTCPSFLGLTLKQPVTFDLDRDVTSWWNDLPIGRTYNVVVNEEKEYAVAVGAQPRTSECRSGLIFIDLEDLSSPKTLGCAAGDGYVHDTQCLVYRDPDRKYYGPDRHRLAPIITSYDVTDKNTTIISRTSYEGAAYTHRGWVTNPNWQEFLVLDDEYDEVDGIGLAASGYPMTYFWDIRSLGKPKQTGLFRSPGYGTDHNQFVIDGIAYQSHYGADLRILDVSSLARDPTGARVKEIGFFDIPPRTMLFRMEAPSTLAAPVATILQERIHPREHHRAGRLYPQAESR